MPALAGQDPTLEAVSSSKQLLLELIDEAAVAKQTSQIEPALNQADFRNLTDRLAQALPTIGQANAEAESNSDVIKGRQFAIIETAARNVFGELVASTPVTSPDFVKVWNLFDILSLLSDDDQCDPALLFWLIEELLDSQTIAGCRKIFDYLESRRERITGKHFKQKNLVILRLGNELLRRLSRAEDTAFCGRVYIFLFQSFPLGDRSSVNLRGEFHVENVTVFESSTAEDGSNMQVDTLEAEGEKNKEGLSKGSLDPKDTATKPAEPDTLYPFFWSLQESFSQPMKLFRPAQFAKFKDSLGATMKLFVAHPVEGSASTNSKPQDEARESLKRKRDSEEADSSEAFNPKYLTSKDLFQLEINDLSFRRNFLVQALIILEFLLSLSKQGKEKTNKVAATNKNVTYSEELSEEDAGWAESMKTIIANDLKSHQDGRSQEGRFFHRTVETVLSRDKNWVYWKMVNCPPIQCQPLAASTFMEAVTSAQRMATAKRLRPTPMGTVSLDFMREQSGEDVMAKYQDPERWQVPELEDYKRKIADDEFEIEMPTDTNTKMAAIAGKASKSWRALRLAARSKLVAFDRIDDPRKIDIVFEELPDDDADPDGGDLVASDEDMPGNREPVVLSHLGTVNQTTLMEQLMDRHKGVFGLVVRHTTREAQEGEIDGKTYHFVKAQEFNQLRDGDRLVEYGSRDGVDYGTSSKAIEAVTETGKVPIIQLDLEAAQFAKDMDFSARYILLCPPETDVSSLPTDEAKVTELFDTKVTVSGEGEEQTEEALHTVEAQIYERGQENGAGPGGDGDMADAGVGSKGEAAEDENVSVEG